MGPRSSFEVAICNLNETGIFKRLISIILQWDRLKQTGIKMDGYCIESIDENRRLEFSGLYSSTISDPEMVALAEKTGEPNLLNLMSPTGMVKIDGDDAAMFLSLCATKEWRQHIERDLQSMCETSEGEPLLTAF